MTSYILVFNAGSSSLKFTLFEEDTLDLALSGEIENLFTQPKGWLSDKGIKKDINITGKYEEILNQVLKIIQTRTNGKISAVGHRIVHGGRQYFYPTLIDETVLNNLRHFIPLAPLHQPYNLKVIDALVPLLKDVPQVACFDTSFHGTQSPLAQLFPLPYEWMEKGVIRYGFHGLSYDYIARNLKDDPSLTTDHKIIIAHLGNGSSACALKGFKSVATSMGFTALDGLMMGTRPGSIDPGVILYLLQEEERNLDDVTHMLYHESGLLGVSGISHDMRELLKSPHPRAKLAIDLYCYLAAKHIASLIPAISGLDALVFTAGIGTYCASIRSHICDYLSWLGIDIDHKSNQAHAKMIHSSKSTIKVYVIATNEEIIIAQQTKELSMAYH